MPWRFERYQGVIHVQLFWQLRTPMLRRDRRGEDGIVAPRQLFSLYWTQKEGVRTQMMGMQVGHVGQRRCVQVVVQGGRLSRLLKGCSCTSGGLTVLIKVRVRIECPRLLILAGLLVCRDQSRRPSICRIWQGPHVRWIEAEILSMRGPGVCTTNEHLIIASHDLHLRSAVQRGYSRYRRSPNDYCLAYHARYLVPLAHALLRRD